MASLEDQHAFLDAAKGHQWDDIKELLEDTPELVNANPAGRWSVLHQAAWAGDVEIVRFLLAHGADAGLRNRDGQTPLDVAPVGPVRSLLSGKKRSPQASPQKEEKRKPKKTADERKCKRQRSGLDISDLPDMEDDDDDALMATGGEPGSPTRQISDASEARRKLEQQAANTRTVDVWRLVKMGNARELLDEVRRRPEVLRMRGPLGETPLHLICLYQHFALARAIVSRYPALIVDQYMEDVYYGESCVHILIVLHRVDMIRFFLETAKEHNLLERVLAAEATGSFFAWGKPCYYGGSLLSFAVSMNMADVVREMVWKYGASPEYEDRYGNNILHMAVVHRLPDMYDFIVGLWTDWADTRACREVSPLGKRRNCDSLTPLCLAAKLGYADIFDHILNATCETEWRFGPVTSVLLPLDELDYIPGVAAGAIEHVVVEGHLELLMLPLIQDLLERKWEVFAKARFTRRFKMALLLAVAFSLMVIYQPNPSDEIETTRMLVHGACKIYTTVVTMMKLRVEVREIMTERLGYFESPGAAFFENIVSLSFCCCFVVSQVLENVSLALSTVALTLSGIFAWTYLLWFLLGFSTTGHLVVMIWTILLGDMVKFAYLISIFMMSFSLAFFISTTQPNERGFVTFAEHLFRCVQMMTSGLDQDMHPDGGSVLKVLLVVYSILVTILMLNILIAMMNDTYNKVSGMAEQQWRLERARIIMSMEAELQPAERESADCRYWFEIEGKRYLQLEKIAPSWARS